MGLIKHNTPVLVTGATGFLASWLIKELLDQSLTVHAIVEDATNIDQVGFLMNLAEKSKGELKLFSADLSIKNSCSQAMKGCNVVFHASPSYRTIDQHQITQFINHEISSVENVLNSVSQTSSIKRVVFTSSCKAMYCDAVDCYEIPGGSIKEDAWNTKASIDYKPMSYLKTLTEKKAWEMAKNQSWELITLNPSFILGPSLNPNAKSPSFKFLNEIKRGIYKYGIPKLRTGIIDVRDLAKAHVLAGNKEDASGRYIASAHNTSLFEITNALKDKYGSKLPLPSRTLPKWVVLFVGPVFNKSLNRDALKNDVGYYWSADNLKIKLELGVLFRPLKETIEDAFASINNEIPIS